MSVVNEIFEQKFLAITVGNVLEYFDFSVFGAFLDIIGSQYFPEGSELMGFLQGAAVFGAAFLMRPLGGVIFGAIGDKYSRELALTWSVLLMLVSSLVLAFLPTYAQWGIVSTLCLIVVRLAQGVACGGEFVGSMIYTIEGTDSDHGYWGGACKGTAVFGNAAGLGVAALLRYCLSDDQVARWGWRVPFVFGGILGFFGMTLRNRLLAKLEEQAKVEPRPLLEVLNENREKTAYALASSVPQTTAIYPATDTAASAPPMPHTAWISVQTDEEEEEEGRKQPYAGSGADNNTGTEMKSSSALTSCEVASTFTLEICVALGFIAFWCCSYYTIFVWQMYFLSNEELIGEDVAIEKRDAWLIVFVSNMAMPFLLPMGGSIGDFVQRLHNRHTSNAVNLHTLQQQLAYRTYGCSMTMKGAAIVMFLVAVPAYKLIVSPNADNSADSLHGRLIMGQALLTLPSAVMGGCMPQVLVELFPEAVRYTCMGISYNFANAIVAGTAAVAQTYLVMSDPLPCGASWLSDFNNYWVSPLQAFFVDRRLHAAGYLQIVSIVAFASLHWGLKAADLKARKVKYHHEVSQRERQRLALEPVASPVGQTHITNIYIQA